MNNKIYYINPVLQETVWGGQKIKEYYDLKTDLNNVAQMYHVIALKDHLDNEVMETGEKLSAFYDSHRNLFKCEVPVMPIRLATSASVKKMSYHLHPDNLYAWKHEHCLGKTSGSIPYEPKGNVVDKFMGHTAKTIEEFKEKVAVNDWEHLERHIKVRDDQYVHTPYGMIHGGGGADVMAIVFAQNSDISYRLYDYGRNDPKRPLHIKQVYDCLDMPEKPPVVITPVKVKYSDTLAVTMYYDTPGEYTAKRLDLNGISPYSEKEFYFLLCADGTVTVEGKEVLKGQTVFISADSGEIELQGNAKLYEISYKEGEKWWL